MATNRKLKKVSWAPDGNLCQIRQFLSEDCPSKVGFGIDRTQMKPSYRLPFNFASKELSLGLCRTKIKEAEKSSSIPIIRWKCPPKINLDPNWLFASGEQSTEVDAQKHRELKVFEAVYPRPTDIPHSPTGALCKDGYLPDDGVTPIIRITPIEDDDAPLGSSCDLGTSLSSGGLKLPIVSDCPPLEIINTCQRVDAVQTPQLGETQVVNSCAEADVAAAASAALTALLKSSEMGSSIDTNMLIEILNNPETVSMLLNRLSSSSTAEPSPKTTSDKVLSSVLSPPPSSDVYSSTSASGKWGGAPMSALCAPTTLKPSYVTDPMLSSKTVTIPPGSLGGPLMTHSPMPSVGKGSQVNLIHKVPSPTTINQMKPYVSYGAGTPLTTKVGPLAQVKGVNYYKNLIKQHGSGDQDFHGKLPHPQETCYGSAYPNYGLIKNAQRAAKNLTSCAYFNTPRGCRKGLRCPFQHDITSYQMQAGNLTEIPNAKRMKCGRELTSMTI